MQDAIAQNRLRYPVAQDNDYKTWNAWGNEYWPAKYLIDAKVGPTLKPGKESTPETYLGSARAQGWVPNQPSNGLHDYTGAGRPLLRSRFAFTGRWKVTPEAATALADGARIDARVVGKAVYLVLSSAGDRPRALRVELDGKPLRTVTVRRQRLYTLVSLPKTGEHTLKLRFAPGLSGYAFTFG